MASNKKTPIYAICISENFESVWLKDVHKSCDLDKYELSEILEDNLEHVISITRAIENKIIEKKKQSTRDKIKKSLKVIK